MNLQELNAQELNAVAEALWTRASTLRNKLWDAHASYPTGPAPYFERELAVTHSALEKLGLKPAPSI